MHLLPGIFAEDLLLRIALGDASAVRDRNERVSGIPFELAGDCVQPTKVYHAIYDGAGAALSAYWLFNK